MMISVKKKWKNNAFYWSTVKVIAWYKIHIMLIKIGFVVVHSVKLRERKKIIISPVIRYHVYFKIN